MKKLHILCKYCVNYILNREIKFKKKSLNSFRIKLLVIENDSFFFNRNRKR